MPRQPYQRCSQAVFEAWLKIIVQAEPLIDSYWGMKLDSLVEGKDAVESVLTDMSNGSQQVIRSKYVVGCDGAGSRARKSVGIELTGGPMYANPLCPCRL
jgi:FAD-dependent monooxygenase